MNRHYDRSRIQSRRRFQTPRCKDMTVCIAAVYKDRDDGEHDRGIVLVTDWQKTDMQTSLTSLGHKFASLAPYIAILGAGDLSYFGDLVGRADKKLRNKESVTVAEAANAYLESEIDWRNEYRENHVLSTYNLNWDSYFEKLENDKLPEAFFTEINQGLRALPMPCSADVIIAGIDYPNEENQRASIIKIKDGIKDNCGMEGFAVIGEGDTIATAEFGYAFYTRFWERPQTMFLCYLAKKRSEAIASVGTSTNLSNITAKDGVRAVSKSLKGISKNSIIAGG